MSVILTGRDMPDSCESCRLQFSNCDIRYNLGVIESTRLKLDKKRHPDCPLKSVEGLIEKIRKMPNDNPSYWHTCDVVDREDLIEIIKEYCEVSEDADCD